MSADANDRGAAQERRRKFRVGVVRTGYGHAEFEIEAASKEDARRTAVEMAMNEVFSEKSSEYEVESVVEIKP